MATPQSESTNVLDISSEIKRRLNSAKPRAIADDNEEDLTIAETPVGDLLLINPDDLIIEDRFRENLDLEELVRSIKQFGQVVPAMARPDMTLIHGYRRVQACKELGIRVLVHVVDVQDAIGIAVEEDRCRKALSAWEMFRITEVMRPTFEQQAWLRRKFGKKFASAQKKGRVDDLLAKHVGISRGSLRKIVAMMKAFEENKERYSDIIGGLQRDGRVDRHYREFIKMNEARYEGPRVQALLLESDWQQRSDAVEAIAALLPSELLNYDGFMLLPTSIPMLPKALTVISKTRGLILRAYRGLTLEESAWLLVAFSKVASDKLDEAFDTAMTDACDSGRDQVAEFVSAYAAGSFSAVSLEGFDKAA